MYVSLPSRQALGLPVLLSVALLALGLSSCGSSSGGNEVKGVVKYKGSPLPGGTITFLGQDTAGEKATAIIDDKGHYSIPKAPLGNNKVVIKGPGRPSDPKAPLPIKIPEKYADGTKSGLSYTVTKGKQTKDFDLTE